MNPIETLRRRFQGEGILPTPNPAYADDEFDRVAGRLRDRLRDYPRSAQFVKSLGDGTPESAEIIALIVSYVSASNRNPE